MRGIFLLLFISTNLWAFPMPESQKIQIIREEYDSDVFEQNILSKYDINIDRNFKIGVVDTGSNIFIPSRSLASHKDVHGHGTHVSSIILSLDKKAELVYPKRTLNSFEKMLFGVFFEEEKNKEDLKFTMHKYFEDLNYMVERPDVKVINLSIAGPGQFISELKAIKKAESNNKMVITAAGNSGVNLDKCSKDNKCWLWFERKYIQTNGIYPAQTKADNVIVVGNINQRTGLLNNSSNYGKNTVHLAVAGTNILGLSIKEEKLFTRMTGTSQAAPVITSVVSKIYAKYPHLNFKQVKHILKINSHSHPKLKYGIFDYTSFLLWMKKDYKI